MPEDTMVFPGVELDWTVGCQSQAAVIALRDPAQLCDLWEKSGQAPEEFVASRDGRILLMDLNGVNQDQALDFADNNPDDFARATVATFCAPRGWKPETPDDVRARLATEADRESAELERQRQEQAAELEREQQAAEVAAQEQFEKDQEEAKFRDYGTALALAKDPSTSEDDLLVAMRNGDTAVLCSIAANPGSSEVVMRQLVKQIAQQVKGIGSVAQLRNEALGCVMRSPNTPVDILESFAAGNNPELSSLARDALASRDSTAG